MVMDNNVKIVSFAEYDRMEDKNPAVRGAVIEVREDTVLLDKRKLPEARKRRRRKGVCWYCQEPIDPREISYPMSKGRTACNRCYHEKVICQPMKINPNMDNPEQQY